MASVDSTVASLSVPSCLSSLALPFLALADLAFPWLALLCSVLLCSALPYPALSTLPCLTWWCMFVLALLAWPSWLVFHSLSSLAWRVAFTYPPPFTLHTLYRHPLHTPPPPQLTFSFVS